MARVTLKTTCCIAGGGPAGMMLGFLLARAGIDVTVIEKHADFLRDFRGDTIHPSTLELMHELGLIDEFLKLPHSEVRELSGQVGDGRYILADFGHVPTHCKFIALMPQWDFLDFLAEHARRYDGFDLRMRTQATGLIEEGGRVVGLRAKGPEGDVEIRADLVVGCDGRHSTLRRAAGFAVQTLGAPMDVLWFRIARKDTDPAETFGHMEAGAMMVVINRSDYWQCAYVIQKGGMERVKAAGLQAFRDSVATLAPFLRDRTGEIKSWDDVKLLTVGLDRLNDWPKPGLICIGDAAHAMSPIGGVGINLAVQDAVAAANIFCNPLRAGRLTVDHLKALQRRRQWPTRVTQAIQSFLQNRVIGPGLASKEPLKSPLLLRLVNAVPILRRIPAWLIGVGVRPEHVRTPEAAPPAPPHRAAA
jgi:2-polyprenyl-6-methoxyphenol hydroxylase-like FAD-dependent oxidoreductase